MNIYYTTTVALGAALSLLATPACMADVPQDEPAEDVEVDQAQDELISGGNGFVGQGCCVDADVDEPKEFPAFCGKMTSNNQCCNANQCADCTAYNCKTALRVPKNRFGGGLKFAP